MRLLTQLAAFRGSPRTHTTWPHSGGLMLEEGCRDHEGSNGNVSIANGLMTELRDRIY